LLEAGELIAYPTDTYYALGCDLTNRKAVAKLHQLKGDPKKPVSILVPDLAEVSRYAKVSNFAYRVIRHLTPGPFTFILEATRLVPDLMQTRQSTIGIRVPDSSVVQGLCKRLGCPLATTSASTPEGDVLIGADDIKEHFGHQLALILDGGTRLNEPSTVLSLVGDEVAVLRQGKGDASAVLGG
jgi:tRNA threonylcarbamoyl adenosine modification protein (Sua5/YciO/YrdC/YwlC family)